MVKKNLIRINFCIFAASPRRRYAKAEADEWGYIYRKVSTMALCSLTR